MISKLNLYLLFFLILISCQQPYKLDQDRVSSPIYPVVNDPIAFDKINTESITEMADKVIKNANQRLALIIEIPDKDRTFGNTMAATDDLYDELNTYVRILYLLGYTHSDELIRNRALQKQAEIGSVFAKLQLSDKFYGAIKAFSISKEAESLVTYKKKYVEDVIENFERNGFKLSAEQRLELGSLRNEIGSLVTEFDSNITHCTLQDKFIISCPKFGNNHE